jgi:hypothetical protein
MAKFSRESIAKVEYDFSEFEDEDGKPILDEGFVKSPSRKLVNSTMKKITKAFEDLGIENVGENPQAITAAVNSVDDEDTDTFEKMTNSILFAMAELCGNTPVKKTEDEDGNPINEQDQEIISFKNDGKPSYDSLSRLDYVAFMGFFGYVMGEMMNPEVSTTGTKPGAGTGRILKSV